MELPVDNKNRAIAYIVIILFLIIVLGLVIYFETFSLPFIYSCLILAILDILIGFYFVKKHDIKRAILIKEEIEVYHRNGLIRIPINGITDIYMGFNYFIDIKGRLSNTYVLNFNTKYVFGKKLFLKFYLKDNKVNGEPNEIQILRENMNR